MHLFGAECFLAENYREAWRKAREVVMHLLMLGVFWPDHGATAMNANAVLMHLLVLGAF